MTHRRSSAGFWAALRHAFAIPGEESLTPREREQLSKLAQKVVERRLTTPAMLMLESVRPLNYIGAHVLLFFRPVISLVFPPERCDEVAALLQKRHALETLISMIERCDAERRGESTPRDAGSSAQT